MSFKKPTDAQLAQLTKFLSENGYGEIGDSAVDVAINLIKEQRAVEAKLRRAAQTPSNADELRERILETIDGVR